MRYVQGLNESAAFLSKKAVEFSPVLFFFSPPLPKRLNCWLIFVSRLDSLPLTLRLSPLILTRLLTPKSEDPSSLASGNELVRWAVRFIAHEAEVSLCECVRVYRGWMHVCVCCVCMCVCVCVNECVWGNIAFAGQEFIARLHFSAHECVCMCLCGSKVLNLYQRGLVCILVGIDIIYVWQFCTLC